MKRNILLSIISILFIIQCSCSKNNAIEDIIVNNEKEIPEQVVTIFSHPGILFDFKDLYRIREQAYYMEDPWKLGFSILKNNSDYKYSVSGPYETVERNEGKNSPAANALSADSQMAYHCALMWIITEDKRYAEKAVEILNAWSYTIKSLQGGDNMLMAAWYGFNLINAAEILRYTYENWKIEDVKQSEKMFKNIFYELIKDWKRGRAGNWDTAITKMHLAVGVFLDDKMIFDRAINFYKSQEPESNGTLKMNIYETGQNFESARDQTHAQMAIGGLAESCEVAWKQGIDLYSLMNNRLLKGFEYTAKYNLGENDLPTFITNVYGDAISTIDRGKFQPIYEMIYNHYHNRVGISGEEIKYTKKVVDTVRKNGGESFSSIHLGLGSLTYNIITKDDYEQN